MIVLSVIYHAIFNWFNILSIIITIIYAACYNKYLSQRLNISNERVERIENWCIMNYLKNKFKTFITLGEAMNKDKNCVKIYDSINDMVDNL